MEKVIFNTSFLFRGITRIFFISNPSGEGSKIFFPTHFRFLRGVRIFSHTNFNQEDGDHFRLLPGIFRGFFGVKSPLYEKNIFNLRPNKNNFNPLEKFLTTPLHVTIIKTSNLGWNSWNLLYKLWKTSSNGDL